MTDVINHTLFLSTEQDKLTKFGTQLMNDLGISKSTLPVVIIKLMQFVEGKQLTGKEKKLLVMNSTYSLIDLLNIKEKSKNALKDLITDIIEFTVNMSKQKTNKSKNTEVNIHLITINLYDIISKIPDINKHNIIIKSSIIISKLLNLINNYKYITILEKKQIVIGVITKFINKIKPDDYLSKQFIKLLPSIIDLGYNLLNHKILLKFKNNCKQCIKCC